jgi:hypothetical protein
MPIFYGYLFEICSVPEVTVDGTFARDVREGISERNVPVAAINAIIYAPEESWRNAKKNSHHVSGLTYLIKRFKADSHVYNDSVV